MAQHLQLLTSLLPLPVICVVGPGDFTTSGHFLVLTGYEDGKFRINDPNSYANSQKLWAYEDIKRQIRNIWKLEGNAKDSRGPGDSLVLLAGG